MASLAFSLVQESIKEVVVVKRVRTGAHGP